MYMDDIKIFTKKEKKKKMETFIQKIRIYITGSFNKF